MDLIYTELPDDVEIVENDHGRFEAESSERDVRMSPQPTRELAHIACLTYLNVRALSERARETLRSSSRYTREQYGRACEEAGVLPFPDSVCASLDRVQGPDTTLRRGSSAVS